MSDLRASHGWRNRVAARTAGAYITSVAGGPAQPGTEGEYVDPMHSLVHAAVADQPLEEVLHLITLLEQSPKYAQAAVDALRAIGVDRSVEDVTRLMALLHRAPLEPHCGEAAVRAAAGWPVQELVQLIGRLAEDQDAPVRASGPAADQPTTPAGAGPEATGRVPTDTHEPEQPGDRPARRRRPRPPRTAPRRAELPLWPRLFAAAALAGCGLS
ncbi:hypothetical protein OH768_51305 [Streptomyces sp. NBC_01622]|uniref:hypothetical protein n=1 Tax=Streptomyces sp. NBC_01622 TaxID=2975903 RepID=UPI003864BAE1|nr:hypothetical protein OH768_51305 [Streptomyces sp. NBC_01622]